MAEVKDKAQGRYIKSSPIRRTGVFDSGSWWLWLRAFASQQKFTTSTRRRRCMTNRNPELRECRTNRRAAGQRTKLVSRGGPEAQAPRGTVVETLLSVFINLYKTAPYSRYLSE
ncbi:hypothetical protein EVAR_65077_1 [Eumeta japonica]|uniref:Uncharacterized protein n=1 Tax=Eumeta variegata TaxID=151549 RepID=A0A4C2A723_EUMVA|nr:hypothetical protein EVAR_65077_1 [Eumeta japonica]